MTTCVACSRQMDDTVIECACGRVSAAAPAELASLMHLHSIDKSLRWIKWLLISWAISSLIVGFVAFMNALSRS